MSMFLRKIQFKSDIVNIAGKTGSFSKDGKHIVSFCGYFPADDPKYTCLVIISNPKNGYPSGGVMAGDVVKKIIEQVNITYSKK